MGEYTHIRNALDPHGGGPPDPGSSADAGATETRLLSAAPTASEEFGSGALLVTPEQLDQASQAATSIAADGFAKAKTGEQVAESAAKGIPHWDTARAPAVPARPGRIRSCPSTPR